MLPGADGRRSGRPRLDNRRVLNAIFFVLRCGTPWRDLPVRYGPPTTAHNRLNRWAKRGIWLTIFEALSSRAPSSLALIDSSIIRAYQHAAGGKKGLPVRLALTAGQAHDKHAVPALLLSVPAGADVVADRGYDNPTVLGNIAAAKAALSSDRHPL